MVRIPFITLFVLFLTACSTMPSSPYATNQSAPISNNGQMFPVIGDRTKGDGTTSPATQQTIAPTSSISGKIAILLPLSGQHADVGQSMLNAAQLALFDVNDPGFELLPFDTKGTMSGASDAVRQAASQGANLILGPLLANNVQAAGATAARYNLQVVGFTTDSSKVGGNVLTLGILPYDQGRRMAEYARQANLNRIVIINPQNAYANAVISAFQNTARGNGVTIIDTINYSSTGMATQIATQLSANQGQFDAIFMPVGNPALHTLTNALTDAGLASTLKPWLGAGLWDDESIKRNRLMQNAVYAAPAQQQRQSFENQYRSVYRETPARLASLAYDATALSAVLLRQNNQNISKASLMNPNGFAGIDGIFRFQSNGLAERGLAVHRITGTGQTTIIDQAPSGFTTANR